MSVVEPKALRWTRDEYYQIAASGVFAGRRVELIRGEVIEMTPQDAPHATGVTLAYRVLSDVFGVGCVVRAQLPLGLGLDSDPEPDVAVAKGSPRDYSQEHPEHAVLVLEVASSSLEYDRTTKGPLYAEAGIPEYWIVNLVDRQLEVFRDPASDGYGHTFVLARSETVAPLERPECSVQVADLLP